LLKYHPYYVNVTKEAEPVPDVGITSISSKTTAPKTIRNKLSQLLWISIKNNIFEDSLQKKFLQSVESINVMLVHVISSTLPPIVVYLEPARVRSAATSWAKSAARGAQTFSK
jgi:hypothetical protein